ncbi:MAG: hypothetical protein WCT53_02425 [Candidatus Gracilibacteria bacterium]
MAFNYESEFIFIGRGDESFLENYSYELSSDPQCEGGKIFMALEILNNQAEAEDVGEAIFATFKQKFYENLKGDPYERFEEALKEANKTIETLKEEKVSRFIGNMNVALGAIVDGGLFISTTGDAEVYMVRRRFVSIVSEGLSADAKGETFVNIANGSLEVGDSVIFSSTRLLRYITKAELGRIFAESAAHKIGMALGELQDFIATEILGRSSVIGISIKQQQLQQEEEEEGGESVFEVDQSNKLDAFLEKLPGRGIFARIKLSTKLPSLSGFFGKIASLLPHGLSIKKPEMPEMKIPGASFFKNMSKGRILVLGSIVLLVFVVGVFWLSASSNQKRIVLELQSKLNSSRDLMNEAITTGQFDKVKAADLLNTSEKTAVEVLNSKYMRADAVKMLDDIQKNRDLLDEVKRVDMPTVVADFSQKRSNVNALGLISLKDRLYGFEYNALYEIILDKLQDPFTISDLETIIVGTDFKEGDSLLFLTRTGKMIEYVAARFGLISTKDGIWKKGVDMKTYNDRLYILDPERNQIWRYTRRKDVFDVGEAYNQNADLSKAVSLAIDSSIYVLNSDGTVIQMYQGQKQDYPLRRMPLKPVKAASKIYTNAELTKVFILEPSEQRVVVFRKDLQNGGAAYQTQYVFKNTGMLRDMLVVDSRLYVMDDKKVYMVNLGGLL